MSTTKVLTPTSRVLLGLARADITPPVGIYHRLWGAARHDRSTGVHRPLAGDVMVFGPADGSAGKAIVRAQLDLCGLMQSQYEDLKRALSEGGNLPRENVVITFSHTHSFGWLVSGRSNLPGAEMIPPYLKELGPKMQEACRRAMANMQDATITYAAGRCNMAANRDYWDENMDNPMGRARRGYACGFNPVAPADDTVLVARVADRSGRTVGTVVNYGCHPTTLAWDNTLISPDYVGAMREEVERATGAPCVFLLGACGDLGPRDGYTGDTAVADRNGRQVAYAALSALQSMGPLATDFEYQGPVVSGATLGAWAHVPLTGERMKQSSRFAGGTYKVDIPLKPKPDRAKLQAELKDWESRQKAADAKGDKAEARNYGAYAERARRWLTRIDDLPSGTTYPFNFSAYRMGDAFWVTSGGEPYNLIQVELRRRFPNFTIMFSPLAGNMDVAYLLPKDRYGKGLYQEEPSSLGPGCLEKLIEAISAKIEEMR